MWKRRGVYALLLAVTCGMYIAANSRQILVVILLLICVPALSGIILVMNAGKVHIACELQDTCIVYQKTGMKIRVKYCGHMALGKSRIQAEYENLLFGDTIKQTIIIERGSRSESLYDLPYTGESCGKIVLRFKKVVCYDLLGLFSKKCSSVLEHTFTVFPQINRLQINMKHLPETQSSGCQYSPNKRGQDVTEVFDVREYQDGDSPRSIHWKLSSKRDELIVREFSHPSNFYTLVLYDTSFDRKQEAYAKIVNSVLGMTASVSKSLLNMNHIHHVGCMCKSDYISSVVEDNESYLQMVTNMMSTSVAGPDDRTVDELLKQNIQERFTKIVLVTGEFNEVEVRNLANYVNLTVLLISDGKTDAIERGSNYDLITLSVDSLTSKVQMLDI
jgi:hypothetical protein